MKPDELFITSGDLATARKTREMIDAGEPFWVHLEHAGHRQMSVYFHPDGQRLAEITGQRFPVSRENFPPYVAVFNFLPMRENPREFSSYEDARKWVEEAYRDSLQGDSSAQEVQP